MNLVATDFLKNGIIYIKIGTVYLKFGEKIEISRSDFFKLDRRRNLYSNFFCVFFLILFYFFIILYYGDGMNSEGSGGRRSGSG
jgi:hypothetical protein